MEVGRKAVGPEFDLDLPSGDPGIGIAEMERRNEVRADPGASTLLPADVMAKRRAAFDADYSGYWIANVANVEFSTRCECPNIRLLNFQRTSEAADAVVIQYMKDPRITSVPIKIPAQAPFQIPVSEASATDAAHTHTKISRNIAKYLKFIQYRNEEFEKHVTEKAPGETGASTFSRRKQYLENQKNKEQARDGRLPSAPAIDTAKDVVLPAAEVSAEVPKPIWSGELPEHWKQSGEVTADSWPRDLEDRRGKFAVIAFIDDEDDESDTPKYPSAAKREPIVIAFGGMHESVDAAKDFIVKNIAPWSPDLTLDVVDMYEWLWPTEVDPDSVPEEHRTNYAGFNKELNTVMTTRKKQLELAGEARQQASAMGVPLRENNVNSLPDISSVVAARKDGMVTYEITDIEESEK